MLCYSENRNAQIVVALLKEFGIKKVVASPGTTNIAIVGSFQYDVFFQMYSSVDERSAAYMACGLAAESGEAVVIICTGATASRNYLPALTEAYYRKLPIVVITGSHGEENIGHLHSQVIDRTLAPKDTVICSVFLNPIKDENDEWNNVLEANRALLEMYRRGGGPVHLNVVAPAHEGFGAKTLPHVNCIRRFFSWSDLPEVMEGRVAIFIGSHHRMTRREESLIECFCEENNCVVFGDHTSGYRGKYFLNFALVACQHDYCSENLSPDLLIHIGEVSGDTYTTNALRPRSVWRVSEDGELKDLFHALSCVFEMPESIFFEKMLKKNEHVCCQYYSSCRDEYENFVKKIPDLNFGNIWIAQNASKILPLGSVVHLGIFNSLRSWNFFELPQSVECSCNVGGFGIDGPMSTLIGASFARVDTLHFLCVGDLAFFYDLNSLGNRHIGNNIRILLINNGMGVEFKKKDHPGCRFGNSAEMYIAAAGHFGAKSPYLVKNFVENLGFEYLSASNKEEFLLNSQIFFSNKPMPKSMVFEIFVDAEDDVSNVNTIRHLFSERKISLSKLASIAKSSLKKF